MHVPQAINAAQRQGLQIETSKKCKQDLYGVAEIVN